MATKKQRTSKQGGARKRAGRPPLGGAGAGRSHRIEVFLAPADAARLAARAQAADELVVACARRLLLRALELPE